MKKLNVLNAAILGLGISLPSMAFAREVWQSDFDYFKHISGTQWEEDHPSGPIYWTETDRTPQYIQLYDSNRDMTFRLFDSYAMWKTDGGVWNLWDHTGHWSS